MNSGLHINSYIVCIINTYILCAITDNTLSSVIRVNITLQNHRTYIENVDIQDRYRNHESLNLIQKHINTCVDIITIDIEKQTYRWMSRWHRRGYEMYFQLWAADRQDDFHRELYQLVSLIRPSRQQADDLWPHCCLKPNQLPLSHERLDSFVIVAIIAWWIDS